MGNADALSRLLLPETVNNIPEPAEHVLLIHNLNESQIKSWTDTDPFFYVFVDSSCLVGMKKMTQQYIHMCTISLNYLSSMDVYYGVPEL